MASIAQPINGPAPPAPASTALAPGARQRCTGCGLNRDLANWPRDDKGVLRKTCIKCKEKRARYTVPPAPAPTAPVPGARRNCKGCGSNRDLANWPRDEDGVLRKTCIKCKEKRARYKTKKRQIEKAANADNDDDDETVSAGGEEEEDEEEDDEEKEDAKPAVIKELRQRMMVGEISAEEAEMVGRDFFDRVATICR